MPNTYVQLPIHDKILQKHDLLKWCGLQIKLCLFMFRCITIKHLNRVTNIDTVCWLGGTEVPHRTAVPQVPVSIPGSNVQGYLYIYVCDLFGGCILFWLHNTYLSLNSGIPVAMLFHLVYITYHIFCDEL